MLKWLAAQEVSPAAISARSRHLAPNPEGRYKPLQCVWLGWVVKTPRLAAHLTGHPAGHLAVHPGHRSSCSRAAFEHREEAIPPTSAHAASPCKDACDGL